MKKKSLLCGLLLLCVSAFAQNINVFWGKTNPVDHKTQSISLICRRGNSIFGMNSGTKNISIDKYSTKDLSLQNEYPIFGKKVNGGGEVISDDYTYNSIITLRDAFFVTVTKYDHKAKENNMYIQEIGDNGRLKGKLIKLASADSRSSFNKGSFDLIPSDDSTKLLVVQYPPDEKNVEPKFTLTIFDESLKQDEKMQIALPFKETDFDVNDIELADDGNIYMMAKIYMERKEKVKGEAKFYYELLSIDPKGNGSIVQYDVKLPEKYIDGISYRADDPKYLICSGLYGNVSGTAKDEVTGIFYMRINKSTKKVESTSIKQLDKAFIADLTSDRKANKGRGISNDFEIRDFVRKSDGGAVLFAEERYWYVVVTRSSDGHGGSYTSYVYYYVRNNIIAVNINPDGTIKWCANIPKFQTTKDDDGAYSSYLLAVKNGALTKSDSKIYIIYNDNPENLDPARIANGDKLKTMTNPKKSTAVVVTLSEDGQFSKAKLFDNKGSDAAIMPSHNLQISDDTYIIPAYNPGFWCCVSFSKDKTKLARIQFK